MTLNGIIKKVWDSYQTELFRMFDDNIAVGDDQQKYIDELVTEIDKVAKENGYRIIIKKII